VFNYLAAAFIWNPAFTDQIVASDLATVLIKAGVLLVGERDAFDSNAGFLTLYVTALMHNSAVLMDDGTRFELLAGFGNKEGRIEVKAHIKLAGYGKPVIAPVCLFWTTLNGIEHCSDELIARPGAWSGAIEINTSGKLTSLA
jgi:hypothetical protein